MSTAFFCPHCGQRIDEDGYIRLYTTNKRTGEIGVILLSTLGTYEVKKSPLLGWIKDDLLILSCEKNKCKLNLEKDETSAFILMSKDGEQSTIKFSALVDCRSAYKFDGKIDEDYYIERFGKKDGSVSTDIPERFTW